MQTEFRFVEGGFVASEEEWKLVLGFPSYECSTLGRFRNTSNGRYMLRLTLAHNGCVHIGLVKDKHQHSSWLTG